MVGSPPNPEEPDPALGLIAALDGRDKTTLRRTVDQLIALRQQAPTLAPRLMSMLAEPGRHRRWPIAYVLAHMPGFAEAAIETLLDTLDDSDPDIRWAVALLLVRLEKSGGHRIAERLITLGGTGTPRQRRMAIYCIRELKLSDAASLSAMERGLKDGDPLVRVAAISAIKTRAEARPEIQSLLLELFRNDPHEGVRNIAALTLAELADPSDEFLAALTAAAQTGGPRTRKAANAALQRTKMKKGAAPSGD